MPYKFANNNFVLAVHVTNDFTFNPLYFLGSITYTFLFTEVPMFTVTGILPLCCVFCIYILLIEQTYTIYVRDQQTLPSANLYLNLFFW